MKKGAPLVAARPQACSAPGGAHQLGRTAPLKVSRMKVFTSGDW